MLSLDPTTCALEGGEPHLEYSRRRTLQTQKTQSIFCSNDSLLLAEARTSSRDDLQPLPDSLPCKQTRSVALWRVAR